MTRLYQYPVVDPQATVKGHIKGLQEASRDGITPIAIFPEGTRTHSGELAPWKRTGLRLLLSQRQWDVYLVVADGLWRARSLSGFMRDVSRTDIRNAQAGPFLSPPPGGDVDAFIVEMRARMEALLTQLREAAS
jgi:1-acyl-sn-glycerol-3-phosphate acyltransferase